MMNGMDTVVKGIVLKLSHLYVWPYHQYYYKSLFINQKHKFKNEKEKKNAYQVREITQRVGAHSLYMGTQISSHNKVLFPNTAKWVPSNNKEMMAVVELSGGLPTLPWVLTGDGPRMLWREIPCEWLGGSRLYGGQETGQSQLLSLQPLRERRVSKPVLLSVKKTPRCFTSLHQKEKPVFHRYLYSLLVKFAE